jgi:hypothetical protein
VAELFVKVVGYSASFRVGKLEHHHDLPGLELAGLKGVKLFEKLDRSLLPIPDFIDYFPGNLLNSDF